MTIKGNGQVGSHRLFVLVLVFVLVLGRLILDVLALLGRRVLKFLVVLFLFVLLRLAGIQTLRYGRGNVINDKS